MTKSQELQILQETIERLGPDSYIGPWLTENIGCIERDLRSDFPPCISHTATAELCAASLTEARQQAKDIVDAAQADATRIRKHAADCHDSATDKLRQFLKQLSY